MRKLTAIRRFDTRPIDQRPAPTNVPGTLDRKPVDFYFLRREGQR